MQYPIRGLLHGRAAVAGVETSFGRCGLDTSTMEKTMMLYQTVLIVSAAAASYAAAGLYRFELLMATDHGSLADSFEMEFTHRMLLPWRRFAALMLAGSPVILFWPLCELVTAFGRRSASTP